MVNWNCEMVYIQLSVQLKFPASLRCSHLLAMFLNVAQRRVACYDLLILFVPSCLTVHSMGLENLQILLRWNVNNLCSSKDVPACRRLLVFDIWSASRNLNYPQKESYRCV